MLNIQLYKILFTDNISDLNFSMKRILLIGLAILFFCKIGVAQQGKNGAEVISVNNTIVNEYTALTADATAGSTSITVTNNSLNTNNRFSSPLSKGDLLMVIQMQGATINGTATDSTWGAITAYNNCGLYEFVQVSGTSGTTTINICPLQNNYTAAGKVQVIRVPRYTSLTIDAGDTLTCDTWNGTQGGVIVTEVTGNTTINSTGAINASALGFRGGALDNSGGNTGTVSFASTDVDDGAEKGESIAGYENDYTTYGGMYCMGAPANGGGGGDGHNAAGGGGGNGGVLNAWTGDGNPDITTSPNYASAWNLEYAGFANSTSSGGGRGGYTWCTTGNNPYTTAPGSFFWGGDDRRNVGGKGGRPLDYSTGRIFSGGGGGAGQEDNNVGGAGGNSGGIIYMLSYGTISGGGSILSNGEAGGNSVCLAGSGDPPGGGGAGGTIILNSAGNISGIALFANGGAGGNQFITTNNIQPDESEGAAGGGGGGYIATSNNGLTTQLNGGANGISTSIGITPFLPNGGTSGDSGMVSTISGLPCFTALNAITGPVTICPNKTYTYSVNAGCQSTVYTWTLPAGWTGTSITNTITVTSGTSGGTVSVSECPFDTSIVVNVNPAPVMPKFPRDTAICGTINLTLNAGPGEFSYVWSTGDTTPVITITDTGTYWVQISGVCDTLPHDSITVLQELLPVVLLGKDTAVCDFKNYILTANTDSTATSYLWSTGAVTSSIPISTFGKYWVTVSNNCGSATDSIAIFSCEGGYVIPDAFTPGNSESANSLIGLLKIGSGPVYLQGFNIYNRWGQLIFTTNNDQQKWDGRFKGVPEPIGVYVYWVKYIDSFGVTKLLKGNITLLR